MLSEELSIRKAAFNQTFKERGIQAVFGPGILAAEVVILDFWPELHVVPIMIRCSASAGRDARTWFSNLPPLRRSEPSRSRRRESRCFAAAFVVQPITRQSRGYRCMHCGPLSNFCVFCGREGHSVIRRWLLVLRSTHSALSSVLLRNLPQILVL